MGCRANIVLVENGRTEIRYHRQGGMSVAPFAMLGPDGLRTVVAGFGDLREELLPDGECEGVLLLHVDKHLIMIDTCHGVASPPPVHRAFVHLLRCRWNGWAVRWAYGGIHEIADAIGCVVPRYTWGFFQLRDESGVFLDHSMKGADVRPAQSGTNNLDTCAVTIKAGAGDDRNYAVAHEASSVLSIGPELVQLLDAFDAEELPTEREAIERRIESAVYIDTTSHQLWVHHWSIQEPGNIAEVEQRWPGWKVRTNAAGLLLHAFLAGEDPEVLKLPDHEAIEMLRREVGGDLDPRSRLPRAVEICSEAVA